LATSVNHALAQNVEAEVTCPGEIVPLPESLVQLGVQAGLAWAIGDRCPWIEYVERPEHPLVMREMTALIESGTDIRCLENPRYPANRVSIDAILAENHIDETRPETLCVAGLRHMEGRTFVGDHLRLLREPLS